MKFTGGSHWLKSSGSFFVSAQWADDPIFVGRNGFGVKHIYLHTGNFVIPTNSTYSIRLTKDHKQEYP